ncbi:MAG: hypothetical protein KDD37_01055 [Bdellovibrionales bacterium]|nr:hypothetical protein [Bdellovibrionales bacterium]
MNNTKLPLLLYAVITLFGVSTQNFDFYYFQEPLTVSFEKTSLALAALRDTQVDEEQVSLSFNTLSSEDLSQQSVVMAASAPSGPRVITFEEGVTVSKSEILMVKRQIDKDNMIGKIAANLTPQQTTRLLQAGDVDQILFEDWSQPSIEEEVKKYIWEDGATENTSITENKEKIFNDLSMALENTEKPTLIINSGRLTEPTDKTTYVPTNLLVKNEYTKPPRTPDTGKGFDSIEPGNGKSLLGDDTNKAQVLKGTFEFTNGMGFLFGQQDLQIVHEIDGVIYDKGFINWSSATFEIPISNLVGEIKAVVIDRDGFVVGEGEIPLEGLPNDTYELSGFHIPLAPKYNGLNIQTISAYSFDDYIEKSPNVNISQPMEPAVYSTDYEGKIENKLIKNGSQQNLQFKGYGNWTTTKYIEAGEKVFVHMFEDSMVNALLETLKEQGYSKGLVGNHGIVWGKIKNFKDASGVMVKITDQDAFGPAYLNHAYLPQKDLYATTKNGYFIFAGVTPGIHSVSFEYQGKTIQRSIEVFRQNITYLDVEMDNVVEQKVTFFDGDTKSETSLEVYIPGSTVVAAPSNPMKIKSIRSSAYNILEFKEREGRFTYRVNLPSTQKRIQIKYLGTDKLSQVLNAKLFSNAIIGFVEPGEFSGIFLNNYELTEKQMVYFDIESKIIPSNQLVSRWKEIVGFMIYDIANGSQSIQIFDEKGIVTQYEVLTGNKTVNILPRWN